MAKKIDWKALQECAFANPLNDPGFPSARAEWAGISVLISLNH